jgi:hypothetical protein
MTSIGTKLGVGTAGCAIAVAASLSSVAPAQAAPVAAPAAPVVFADVPLAPVVAPASPVLRGPADVPQGWWFGNWNPQPRPTVSNSWFAGKTSWISLIFSHFCGGYNTHRI